MDHLSFIRAFRGGFLLFACCIAMPALGDDIYFSVDGAQQGRIVGEMLQKGLEGKMRALGFSAGLRVPIDATTGQMTSKRVHEPLLVMREPGRGTAQLMHAIVTSEPLKEVRFDFYAPRIINGVRAMTLYQTIRLINAKLVGFERKAEPATDLSAGAVRSLEELRFTYERIELIDVERNVSTQDDWLRPL